MRQIKEDSFHGKGGSCIAKMKAPFKIHSYLAGIGISFMAACTAVNNEKPDVAHDERFAGGWIIDNSNVPIQMAAERSLYDFSREGAISKTNHYPDALELGQFYDYQRGIFCDMDKGSWHSIDSLTLSIDCKCSDSADRNFRIEFPGSFLKDDSQSFEVPDTIAAANDAAWTWTSNASYWWAWTKCRDVDSCNDSFKKQ